MFCDLMQDKLNFSGHKLGTLGLLVLQKMPQCMCNMSPTPLFMLHQVLLLLVLVHAETCTASHVLNMH